jgi:hypothetical protein
VVVVLIVVVVVAASEMYSHSMCYICYAVSVIDLLAVDASHKIKNLI